MDINSIQDLRVVDLKKELDIRGLPKSGSKKELVDRLKNFLEQEEQQSQPTDLSNKEHGPEAPAIEEDGENEIVKNYLAQRRQLLSQQLEQKKRYEEEASRSHSECETEERASSSDRRESGAVAVATEDSGDSTDVDSPPPEQINEPSEQMHQLETFHAGDGDKSTVTDAPEAAELLTKTSQSRSPSPPIVQKTEFHEADGDKASLPVVEHKLQRRSRSRSSESDRSRSKSDDRRERSRSSSASDKSDTREKQHRGRSKSRSASRSSSRSKGSASDEEGKVKSHPAPRSRSSSEEDHTRDNRSRSRSSSAERGKDVSMVKDRSRSRSAENDGRSESREMKMDEQSRSRSPSAERPKSAAEAQVGRSASDRVVDQDGTAQLMDISEPIPVELVQPMDLMVEESQLSIDSRLDVVKSTSEVTQPQTASTVVDSTEQVSTVEDVPATKPASDVPEVSFTAAKPVRKRKWGSATVREVKTIDISTDSLKNLGLEISAEALAAELPIELSEPAVNGDASGKESEKQTTPQTQRTVLKSQDSVTGSDTRAPKIRRIVYKDDSIPTATTEDTEEKTDGEQRKVADGADEGSAAQADSAAKTGLAGEGEPAKVVRSTSVSLMVNDQAKVARSVSLTVEDPVDVGRRAPSPPRRAPSNVVHVTGLVRPYTLGQLKELLGRTGTLVADGFWIDNIKSHCYVTYETVEQAVATREALHGKRWPASNPKVLGVEFRTADEVEFRKTNKVQAGPGAAAATPRPTKPLFEQAMAETRKEQDKNKPGREQPELAKVSGNRDSTKSDVKSRPKDSKENAAPPQPPVREWDRHKLRQSKSKSKERRPRDDKPRAERERERDRKEPDSRGRTRSRDEKKSRDRTDKSAGTKVEEEPPAKLLDDLFRKTKATPCIYWLPLTDEQVAVRLAEEKERQAMQEKRRMERDQQLEAERQQRLKARDERDKERGRESDRGGARPQRKFSEENMSRRRKS